MASLLALAGLLGTGLVRPGADAAVPDLSDLDSLLVTARDQPPAGPGGAEYPFGCTRASRHGRGGTAYELFEPSCPANGDGAGPATEMPLPIVVFLHGFSAVDPVAYEAWIDHLVRRGSVVVFPVYQATALDLHQTANALVSTRAALAELRAPGHPPTDPGLLYLAGHSAGAGIAVNLAAEAGRGLLPVPAGVYAAEPAVNIDRRNPGEPDPFGFVRDWRAIPAGTRLVLAIGDRDNIVNDETARLVWERTGHVTERAYALLRSDGHGTLPLTASHFAPLGTRRGGIPGLLDVDAMDFLLWGQLDALVGCGRTGRSPCPLPDAIGTWSDGTPPRPAEIRTAGPAFERPWNQGNAAQYLVFDMLVALRPLCPLLGGLCGTDPGTPGPYEGPDDHQGR